jgi:hypothetical protein
LARYTVSEAAAAAELSVRQALGKGENSVMPARLLLVGAALLVASATHAGDAPEPVKSADLYPIYEHGVGRWLAFDSPLQVQHDLDTPGLTDYRLKLRVSILLRDGKQAEVRLSFTQQGTFKPIIRPRMPGSSHVDLVIGDKSIAELRLTGSGSGNEGDERLTEDFFARVPLTVFKKMLAAKTIRGYIYWRAENEIVERNELRLFTLDAKSYRTKLRLVAGRLYLPITYATVRRFCPVAPRLCGRYPPWTPGRDEGQPA